MGAVQTAPTAPRLAAGTEAVVVMVESVRGRAAHITHFTLVFTKAWAGRPESTLGHREATT